MRKSAIKRKLVAMERYLSELEILSQHSLEEFEPIKVLGKPVSEIIIEDRGPR